MINQQNWTYSRYELNQVATSISLGGNHTGICYSVSSFDQEHLKDLNSRDFNSLSEAISYINTEFEEWEFKDLTQSSGGCESCEAH